MQEIKLREYQLEIINGTRNFMRRGYRHICVVAPCGAGKTIIMGWMIREAWQRGYRCIFFVHRKELIEQTAEAFRKLGISFGIIAAGVKPDYEQPVQIASVQTLTKRINKITAPDMLVCDECHHIKAATYLKIVRKFDNAWLIGTTATPKRTDGDALGDVFDQMVVGASAHKLMELGNLAPYDYFAPTSLDVSKVRLLRGDYDPKAVEKMVAQWKIVGDIVENYKKYANGKSAICYCVTVKHSKMIAKSFNDAGISAAHCDFKTPKAERARIIADFRAGKLLVLCNVNLFGEGVDVPNVHAVILARPTKSTTLYIQQAMRPLRPDPNDPNKKAVIIDHVDNYKRHGFPDDDYEWSLKKEPEHVAHVKKCPRCGAVVKWGTERCPNCEYKFPVITNTSPYKRSTEVEKVKGELSKIYSSDKIPPPVVEKRQISLRYDEFLVKELKKGNPDAVKAALLRALEYAQSSDDYNYLWRRTGGRYSTLIWKWRKANRKF